MNRNSVLAAKAVEIRESLGVWLTQEGMLAPNEALTVTLAITKTVRPAVPTQASPSKERRRWNVLSRPLTEEDWRVILSLSWNSWQRRVVETLHQRDNREISVGDRFMAYHQFAYINVVLRSADAKYRLRVTNSYRGQMWDDSLVKFYAIR